MLEAIEVRYEQNGGEYHGYATIRGENLTVHNVMDGYYEYGIVKSNGETIVELDEKIVSFVHLDESHKNERLLETLVPSENEDNV